MSRLFSCFILVLIASALTVVRAQPVTVGDVRALEEEGNPVLYMTIADAWLDGVDISAQNSLEISDPVRARAYLKRVYDLGPEGEGWPDAVHELGNLYAEGKGVDVNLDVAEAYLRMAIDAGEEKSKLQLAEVLLKRADRDFYLDEVRDILTQAYFSGEAAAAFRLSEIAETSSDANNWRALGEQEMMFQAGQGKVSAIRNLARAYEDGLGGEGAMGRAIELFEQAATAGDISSVYALGKIYADINSPYRDPARAGRYLRQAAEAGRLDAALFIATASNETRAFDILPTERVEWLNKAAETGNVKARLARAQILLRGGLLEKDTAEAARIFDEILVDTDQDADELLETGEYMLSEAVDDATMRATALSLLEKAQARGAKDASLILAEEYLTSDDPDRRARALTFYEEAAEQGETRALLFLGRAWREGQYFDRDINKAIAYFENAAEQGESKEAMVTLADIYLSGEGGLPVDPGAATYWLDQAAQLGSTTALRDLGRIYNEGRFADRDVDRAIDLLEQAANGGSDSAAREVAAIFLDPQTRDDVKAEQWLRLAWNRNRSNSAGLGLAELLQEQNRRDEAIGLYENLARRGEVDAVVELVQIYLDGEPSDADLQRADFWSRRAEELGQSNNSISLQLARAYMRSEDPALNRRAIGRLEELAEQGITSAESQLAKAYRDGIGVQPDMEASFEWTRRAADAGATSEMMRLASYYENGIVVGRDLERARGIYLQILTVEPRSQQAPLRLALLQRQISRSDESLAKSVEYLQQAAENGSSEAQIELADAYTNGAGVPQDGEEALNWLIRARDGGEDLAYVYLGRAYASGFGVPIDPERAFHAFYQGAEQGSSEAMAEVGRAYIMGFGTEKNIELGMSFMREAAGMRNASAMYELGELYRTGIYVEKDIPEALRWYRLAANEGNMKSMINIGMLQSERGSSAQQIAEANRWLQVATDLGHTQAPRFLARIAQGLPAAKE